MIALAPTPYPDVNHILNLLFTDIKDILQAQLVGMYLFGSLANGDFDQHSDIDVLVVTNGDIADDIFMALHDMHTRLAEIDSPWAVQQEVSYIPKNALRRFDAGNNHHPHLDRDKGERLHMMTHESDWIIQRHLLRENGIVLTGPTLKTLIDPVTPQELRRAVIDVLPLWVNPILADPGKIKGRGYQSYCVLSLCRMLYTLQNKAILSKRAAAGWGMETLHRRWQPLIERAILGRKNSNQPADPDDINQTIEMMRYTLEVSKQPSIFPDVNEVLNMLLSKVKRILKEQFVGMYLYGSLSSGDFNPATSDIDFLVVTTDTLTPETVTKLEAMHQETWATSLKRAGKLEGAYLPSELVCRHDPNGPLCPTVNEGKFYPDRPGSDWIIQRHVVREHGVVLDGPDPKTLIEPVGPDEIRRAVMGILHEWWFPMLDDPSWLRDHDNGYRAFAVVTMCRVLHALEYGTIVSKPKAIHWAGTQLDKLWKELIEKAAPVSPYNDVDIPLDKALNFIGFTREQTLKNEANTNDP
ncbi:MAG TPA: aminoglycoside adenylyltransferase domain-containing protein [Anaerolineales bacterium]|nr:aminoglycoside adenylyltransferase domain-containing protein [Anaerolineales bacterium]